MDITQQIFCAPGSDLKLKCSNNLTNNDNITSFSFRKPTNNVNKFLNSF